jgi:hypothetical protein
MNTNTQPSEHAKFAGQAWLSPDNYPWSDLKKLIWHIDQHAIAPAVAERDKRIAELEEEILNEIEDAARGACHTAKQEREHNGIAAGSLITDSGAISANAENLRRLAEAERFRIIRDFGRMVIGYWPENDPNRSKELT